jgi:LPS-assembly lipoprotein
MQIVLILLAALSLSSCGFTPMYGTQAGKPTAQNLEQIDIAIIPNREGQFLRNALMDRFYTSGVPTAPTHRLKISTLQEQTYNFDITVDSEATRRQLKLSTAMHLIDLETNKTVLNRPLLSIASYNVLQSEFSTIVTEQSARENALNDLARQIERQLSLY